MKKRKKKSKLDNLEVPLGDQWKNSKTMTMNIAFQGMQIPRACIRFKCEKCKEPFIGLLYHRDRIPKKCSTCDPDKQQSWRWSLAT